jgi:hypothetical protein
MLHHGQNHQEEPDEDDQTGLRRSRDSISPEWPSPQSIRVAVLRHPGFQGVKLRVIWSQLPCWRRFQAAADSHGGVTINKRLSDQTTEC